MNMNNSVEFNQRLLERLTSKQRKQDRQVSSVSSPGARVASWVIKVKSVNSYNSYNVKTVAIGTAGTEPIEYSEQLQAVNIAESFTQTGQLPEGTYAVMFRVGDKNVFEVDV